MEVEERRADREDRRTEEEATRRQEELEQQAEERRADQEQQHWVETIQGLIPGRMAPPPAGAAPRLMVQKLTRTRTA